MVKVHLVCKKCHSVRCRMKNAEIFDSEQIDRLVCPVTGAPCGWETEEVIMELKGNR